LTEHSRQDFEQVLEESEVLVPAAGLRPGVRRAALTERGLKAVLAVERKFGPALCGRPTKYRKYTVDPILPFFQERAG
jgi:hypothetical protein